MLFTILFMYVCALGLAPFVVFAMYLGFGGDQMREREARERVAAAQQPIELDQPRARAAVAAASAHRPVSALPVAG